MSNTFSKGFSLTGLFWNIDIASSKGLSNEEKHDLTMSFWTDMLTEASPDDRH